MMIVASAIDTAEICQKVYKIRPDFAAFYAYEAVTILIDALRNARQSVIGRAPSVTIAVRSLQYWVVGYLSLKRLSEMILPFLPIEDQEIAVADATGFFVAHSEYSKVEQREQIAFPEFSEQKNTVEAIVEQNKLRFHKISPMGWAVVIFQNIEKANEPLKRFMTDTVVFT